MTIAVFDTNVLASGIAGIARQESTPGELLRRWRAGEFTLVVSEPILAECERTLQNPYFSTRLSLEDITAAINRLRNDTSRQPITSMATGVASHPEDDLVLATAISANATYLVTGDRQLLALGVFQDVTILSPRAFLARLAWKDDE